MAEAKLFGALLNGLAKRTYFADTEFSNEVLKEQIYPTLSDPDFEAVLLKAEALLQDAALNDYDFQRAETAAAEAKLTDGELQGFLKFWKAQKSKIHEQLVKDALWGPRLKGFSWRIDVKTKSKHIRELNEATAVMELDIKHDDDVNVVRFEMDAAQINHMLEQLQRIEAAMSQ